MKKAIYLSNIDCFYSKINLDSDIGNAFEMSTLDRDERREDVKCSICNNSAIVRVWHSFKGKRPSSEHLCKEHLDSLHEVIHAILEVLNNSGRNKSENKVLLDI